MAEEETKPDLALNGFSEVDILLIEEGTTDTKLYPDNHIGVRAISYWNKIQGGRAMLIDNNLLKVVPDKDYDIKLIAFSPAGSVAISNIFGIKIIAIKEEDDGVGWIEYKADRWTIWRIFDNN